MIHAWLAIWQYDRRFGALISTMHISFSLWKCRLLFGHLTSAQGLAQAEQSLYWRHHRKPFIHSYFIHFTCCCWLPAVKRPHQWAFLPVFLSILNFIKLTVCSLFFNRWQYGRKSVNLLLAFVSNEFVYTRRMFIIWGGCGCGEWAENALKKLAVIHTSWV